MLSLIEALFFIYYFLKNAIHLSENKKNLYTGVYYVNIFTYIYIYNKINKKLI